MKPLKSKKMAHRVIAGEAFVLDASLQTLHSMNETGSRIWELIDGRRGLAEIAEIIAGEFEVSPETAGKDVEEFLLELQGKGLILNE